MPEYPSDGTPVAPGTYAQGLIPTAVMTAPYSATPKDYVLVDATAASVALALPTAPVDLSRIGIKLVATASNNVATFACGGSDHLNLPTGPTSGTITLANQAVILQYAASTATWIVQSSDLPLSALDTRYSVGAGGNMGLLGSQTIGAGVPGTDVKTFTVMPEVHAAAGSETPILGRTPTDAKTQGAWNVQHDGIAGDLLHLTAGPNTGPSRTITDAVLNGTTTITSVTAAFTSGPITAGVGTDVGKIVAGAGIPVGTKILSVQSATSATLTAAATAGSGVTVVIGAGPNANGAVIAIGVDNGGTGIVVQNKSTGTGIIVNQLDSISSASAAGLQISHQSSVAPAFRFIQQSTASAIGMLITASSAPAGSYFMSFNDNGIGGSLLAGRIAADVGTIDWRRTIQAIAPNSSGTPVIRVADEVASNPTEAYIAAKTNGEAGLSVYRWSASGALMYAHKWQATSDRFKLQVGNGAIAKGAETLSTLIEVRANATPQMAFFGAAVASQPSATADIKTALVSVGLIAAAGSATPLNLEGGLLTSAGAAFSANVVVDNTIGYRAKESGGTLRTIASISAGGTMLIGDANSSTVQYQGTSMLFAPGSTPAAKLTINTNGLTLADASNITFNGTTGTKIGTTTTGKLAFFNATPIVQPSGTPVAATDLATVITLANDLRTKLLALGLAA